MDPDCRTLAFKGQVHAIPPHIVCPVLGDLFVTTEDSISASQETSDELMQERLAQADLICDDDLRALDL